MQDLFSSLSPDAASLSAIKQVLIDKGPTDVICPYATEHVLPRAETTFLGDDKAIANLSYETIKSDANLLTRNQLQKLTLITSRCCPTIKYGDTVALRSIKERKRNNGLFIWDGSKVIELEHSIDKRGYVPEKFKVSKTEFSFDYWTSTIRCNLFIWPHNQLIKKAVKNVAFGPITAVSASTDLESPSIWHSQFVIKYKGVDGSRQCLIFWDSKLQGKDDKVDFIELLKDNKWNQGSEPGCYVIGNMSNLTVLKV